MQDDFRPVVGSVAPSPKIVPLTKTKSFNPDGPFKTPEQMSASSVPAIASSSPFGPASLPHGKHRHIFNVPWPPTRRQLIIASLVLIVSGAALSGYAMYSKPSAQSGSPAVSGENATAPAVITVPSTLSGLPVASDVNKRPVVGVMIENSPAARPQAGLSEAGVVFEAVAEGGITRFLALFQDQQPGNVGPIRSARPYYVQWNQSFKAAYAHVGGSNEALDLIKSSGTQDLNQFNNAGLYRRDKSRASPHNVYSDIVTLKNAADKKGYKSDFTGFARKPSAQSATPNATTIDLGISSGAYNPRFSYDKGSNTYLRSQNGEAHTDNNNSKQIAPSVVVALVVPLAGSSRTSQGSSYSNYQTIGSGKAIIFQNGIATIASWNKANADAQITFKDQAGAELKLNPGQTWLTALSSSSKVTYK